MPRISKRGAGGRASLTYPTPRAPKPQHKQRPAPNLSAPTSTGRILARMRHVARPQLDPQLIDRTSASMRAWLVALTLWFAEVLEALPDWALAFAFVRDWRARMKAKVAADLRMSGRVLAMMLICAAYARVPAPRAHRHTRTAAGAARGFRRSRKHKRFFRCATASALRGVHVGSLRQRAERLRASLDKFDTLVGLVFKRLTAMYRRGRAAALVLIASRDAHMRQAFVSLATIADTS